MKRITLLACLVVCGALFSVLMFLASRSFSGFYIHNDFYSYWIAGKLTATVSPIYGITPEFKQIKSLYDLPFHWATGYSYPPFLATIAQFFSNMSPTTVAWGWFGINTVAYGWLIWKLYWRFRSRWILLYLLTFVPALGSIAAGQVNVMVALGLYAWFYGRSVFVRAFGISVAAIVKIYPALLLIIQIIKMKWRVVLFSGFFMSIMLLLPILQHGPQNTIDYLTDVLPSLSADPDGYFTQQSVNAVVARVAITGNKYDSSWPPALFFWMMKILVFGMIGGLVWWTAKNKPSNEFASYVWLAGLTLVAGRTTWWNFMPTLFGQVYLLSSWKNLSDKRRAWLLIASFCSNAGLLLGWLAHTYLPVETAPQRIVFTLLTSLGFIYGVIQFLLLTRGNLEASSGGKDV